MKLKPYICALLVAATPATAALACTNLLAGKKATADGSVMVTYAADSHNLFGELIVKPAADHAPGSMRKVIDWDTSKPLGEIPQVAHTYNVVGNMNEHQLAIGESTWGGHHELADTTGQAVIDYGSLMQIALERCTTAREAVKLMTDLVAEFGYASEGESFSIADKDELWVLEMVGKGAEKGAVWAAVLIPENAISGHANEPRIRQLKNYKDTEVMLSPDAISFARERGYFNGKDEDFSFADAYADHDVSTRRGCDARVWSYFRRFAPDTEKYYSWCVGENNEPMPLYVVPEKKVSLSDMQERMRDHFEDTPFEMHSDIGAGPNHSPYRWRPMEWEVDGKKYCNERAIATQQTGWSFISQSRDWLPDEVGGIFWFGTDDTNTSVYMPFYCSMTEAPYELRHGNGDMNTFSMDSNFWMTNWVANQAYNRYDLMIPDIRRVQQGLENGFITSRPESDSMLEALSKTGDKKQLVAVVNKQGADIAKQATDSYRDLAQYLLVKFMDGNMKKTNEDGSFIYDENNHPVYPSFPGYNEDYYRNIVRATGNHFQLPD